MLDSGRAAWCLCLQARSTVIAGLPAARRVQVIAEMPEEDRAAVLVTMVHSERRRIMREIKLTDPALVGLTMEFIRCELGSSTLVWSSKPHCKSGY